MMMDNRKFAEQLYHFLKDNDVHSYYADTPPEDCIAELEDYLSDLHIVRETIKDIENISDMFADHEVYVDEVKPLLNGLREIQGELEVEQRRRMVGDTGYEVKHAVHVGEKEIVFAEDKGAENGMCWFVGDYTSNDLLGQYADCQVSDDYLEALGEFTGRVNTQIEAMQSEIDRSKTTCEVFTTEHCYPHDYSKSIDGKIVAIKAGILRPEYRRGEVQIVLVSGGSGARANPNGRAVFCYHLNDGKHTRFDRSDVQGEVKSEFVPKWAAEKAAAIQAEKASPQKNPKDREDR
ncbi:hypothetical protein LJC63_11335 [Ruminococcaceae bacterium OttesenSCG-928-L11]|nr:hypothetical protein [Ruminococcaceae bacterium OttesenSCG-928-L11]